MIDYEDDAHFCLKCHATILGLENYVNHRKSGCDKNIVDPDPSKSPLPSQLLPDEIGLKADDFFSSLQLRSSSKKPAQSTSGKNFTGILTRSKITAAIQATTPSAPKEYQEPQQSKSGKNVWIGGNQLKDLGTGDNQSKLIKAVANLERRKDGTTGQSPPRIGTVYEETDEDSEEYDYEDEESSEEDYAPPRNYTGGKWKPTSPVQWGHRGGEREWGVPPPSYTGGKWKPKRPSSPPPSYTKGKWKPSEDDGGHPSTGGKYPPPGHTKGKWKPSVRVDHYEDYPPPTHTKGKWKPRADNDEDRDPPPTHTKGKWRPRTEQDDDRYPPPMHTKGKWKPRIEEDIIPPPTHTKGKWKPKLDDDNLPPPTHTKGKWKPKTELDVSCQIAQLKYKEITETNTRDKAKAASESPIKKNVFPISVKDKRKSSGTSGADATILKAAKPPKSSTNRDDKNKTTREPANVDGKEMDSAGQSKSFKIMDESPFRKSSGTVQYWCSTCNRSLASKIVYERHLRSELHFKRTRPDGEFDDVVMVKKAKIETAVSSMVKVEPSIHPQQEKKRNRRRMFEICVVCRSKVNRYLMGKHLISHYHYRKGDITTDEAKKLVLDNILGVVLESPFECSVCKFYCNTHEQFLNHWKSSFHETNDQNYQGYFLCVFCKQRSDSSQEMLKHLNSAEHLEVVSVINRSVPITIKKITEIPCLTCSQKFSLNVQLLNHCKRSGHDSSNVSIYEKSDYECKDCNKTFLKAISLQRHFRKKHKHDYFFCGLCNMKFKTSIEVKRHRTSSKHRYTLLEKKRPKGSSLRRKCEYCDQFFGNFMLLKEHLKAQHPEHKIRCPYCGAHFTVPQELSNHLKAKACKFPESENPADSENPYRCDKCPYSSDSTSELLFHVALHDDPLIIKQLDEESNGPKIKALPRYKCPLCEKFFPKYSLQPHIRLHTEERPYICKVCDASFTRKNNLLYHEKNHERKRTIPRKESKEAKAFLCSTCGAGFSRKFTLQQHMLIHSGKVCRCPEIGCFFTARKMSELQEHFKTHSSEKNFSCDLCGYKGKTKKLLKRHMTIHDEVKKYSCSVCSFTARTAAHLKRHVRLHTGAKPYKCPYCDYKCNNMENLRRHVLSTTKHPGKCIYECKFCKHSEPFNTNVAKDFKTHLMLNHHEEFGNNKDAATYVAGIYEAHEDNTYLIDVENLDDPPSSERIIPKTDPSGSILKLKTNEDPVVAQLIQPTELGNKDRTLDQMLPMFIIPKDDAVNVEIASDSWNLIGRYDVEESGNLVPFQSGEDEELFQEHF